MLLHVIFSRGHDAWGNAHGHELLEQQFAGIGDLNLGNLQQERERECTSIHAHTHTDPGLVLAAPALKCVGLKVGNGNEPAQVTDVNAIGVGCGEESLVEELGRSVSYLTVPLHLTKPQTTITAEHGDNGANCTTSF